MSKRVEERLAEYEFIKTESSIYEFDKISIWPIRFGVGSGYYLSVGCGNPIFYDEEDIYKIIPLCCQIMRPYLIEEE